MGTARTAYPAARTLAQTVNQDTAVRMGNALVLQHQVVVQMPIALGRSAVLMYARLQHAMLLAIAQMIVRNVISSNAAMEGAAPRPAPANRFHAG